MATTGPDQVRPGTSQWSAVQSFMARDRLARLVVWGSFLTLFLMVLALLSLAAAGNSNAVTVAEKTFTTMPPGDYPADGYPFTGMGYTYDWGASSSGYFGVNEFIVEQGTTLDEVSKVDLGEFCAGTP
jgi:hypothetical protein